MLSRLSWVAALAAPVVATACQDPTTTPAASATAAASQATAAPEAEAPPKLTHGVAIGEVSSQGAVVWARASRVAAMHVALDDADAPVASVTTEAARDFTGRAQLTGLAPGKAYRYRVWLTRPGDAPGRPGDAPAAATAEGRFVTAPAKDASAPVRFAVSGDLAGQNFCRDKDQGFAIFDVIRKAKPTFFIGLGDMIYADDTCTAVGRYGNFQWPGRFGPATTRQGFWDHYRYARQDPGFAGLLAEVGYYGVVDDHEVVNDVGPEADTPSVAPYDGHTHLLPMGLDAFVDYQPMMPPAGERVLHRSARWGKHVELFFLDTRQHRSRSDAPDGPAKTMLGRGQREWLAGALRDSDATWKVIVSSVPIAIPTAVGSVPDGWATRRQGSAPPVGGYEHELAEIFASLRDTGTRRSLWLTTDVHFATLMRHRPFGDASLEVYELAVGPLSAAILNNPELSDTFHPERLFEHAPRAPDAVAGYADAKRWLNFGVVEVDEAGKLSLTVTNALGDTLLERAL